MNRRERNQQLHLTKWFGQKQTNSTASTSGHKPFGLQIRTESQINTSIGGKENDSPFLKKLSADGKDRVTVECLTCTDKTVPHKLSTDSQEMDADFETLRAEVMQAKEKLVEMAKEREKLAADLASAKSENGKLDAIMYMTYKPIPKFINYKELAIQHTEALNEALNKKKVLVAENEVLKKKVEEIEMKRKEEEETLVQQLSAEVETLKKEIEELEEANDYAEAIQKFQGQILLEAVAKGFDIMG